MKIEIQIDDACTEPKVINVTNQMTPEIQSLAEFAGNLPACSYPVLVGFWESQMELLDPEQVVRIYCESQKVYAQTQEKSFLVRKRLYELETLLEKRPFVRISQSEIINLKQVRRMDPSFAGTIEIHLAGGICTYVSRRYLPKIKQILGI